jgi:uncharacterized membrane protein YadS
VLDLGDFQYGVLAGMTVYAVPQVLAATYPVSARAGEVGTLVKLIRVLLLVPLLAVLSVSERRRGAPSALGRSALTGALPAYLVLFLLLASLRTAGMLPDAIARPARIGSHALTVLAMAALGMSVELARLRAVGWRTALAASLALVVLTLCALGVALAA